MLWLPENTARGVFVTCGCSCPCLCLWFLSVAHVCSGFVMIAQASCIEMGVNRLSRPLRVVGKLPMLDARPNTMQRVESVSVVLPGAGLLQLVVPSIAVGVRIDHCCVPDGVEATYWLISAIRELFTEDEGMEFWPWFVAAMELPP